MSRVIFGVHAVQEAFQRNAKQIQELWVAKEGRLQWLVDTAEQKGVSVRRVQRTDLNELTSDASHQDVAAIVGDFGYCDVADLVEGVVGEPLLLVVDGVTDPQNLGAMVRAAYVMGATGMVLTKDRCVHITPTVVRVSSGATEHMPCAMVTNLNRALEKLKELGVWIAATVESGGTDPAQTDLRGPLALVLGNEQRGIRPLVQKHCDFNLTIPVTATIASLNVASATAVLFYEANRQRRIAVREASRSAR